MAILKKLASQDYVVETATEIIYTPQELTDEQRARARENIGFPEMTEADAGKFFRISSDGQPVLETVVLNSETWTFTLADGSIVTKNVVIK